MMKRILTIALILFAGVTSAQTPWNKQSVYTKPNGMMPDSVMYVPRTKEARSGLYTGGSVGDSGRLAYADKTLWLHNDTGWRKIAYYGELPDKVLDSARRSNDTLYFRTSAGDEIAVKMEGIRIPGVLGLQDSLNTRPSWSSRLTPLMTGANLPIQPTDSLTQALAKLQAQINSFIGQFVQLNPGAYDSPANPKLIGKMNIRGSTGSNYGLLLERGNTATDDIAIGWKSGADTVGRIGLLNRGLNHITLDNLKDKIRLAVMDTSCIDFITMNPDLTGRIGIRFWNGRLLFGDSMTAAKVFGRYPIDVQSTSDTSIRTTHKIVTDATLHATGGAFSGSITGVTETLSDNSTKMASTAFVKGQGYLTPTITSAVSFSSTLTSTAAGGYRASVGGFNWNFGAISDGWSLDNTGTRNIFKVFQSDGRTHFYNRVAVNNPTDDGSTPLIINGATASPGLITSGSLTLTAAHSTVVISNSGHVITLPTASASPGRIYHIVNETASPGTVNTVRLNGVSGVTAIPANAEWTLQSINSLWYVIQE